MQDVLDFLKALGDENRLRILLSLQDGELCVCQLTELLALAPSTVSKHLSILRSARLVVSRKEGRWIHYRLSEHARFQKQKELVRLVLSSVDKSDQAIADGKIMAKIRKADKEVLCHKLLVK